LKEASKRKVLVTERERAYIELWEAKLMDDDSNENRSGRKKADELFDKLLMTYPDDVEAKALYWLEGSDGKRYGNESVLQEILKVQPDHVGALHYRIHNWDSKEGRFAVDSCLALTRAAPNCGHLQHMPGHVLSGVGLWHEAAIAMDAATRVEKAYMHQRLILPEENWNYIHNLDYLGYIQEQLGLYGAALVGAEQLLMAPHPTSKDGRSGEFLKQPLVRLLLKYEKWDEILALTNRFEWNTNDIDQRILRDYAETRAYIGLGRLDDASDSLSRLREILKTGAVGSPGKTNSNAVGSSDYVKSGEEIMQLELRGLLQLARTDWLEGIEMISRAARLQEKIWRDDPPPQAYYLYNVLGEAYLRAGSPRLAIPAYRKTLETVFNDGFALSGLVQAYAEIGDRHEAGQALGQLQAVWSDADRPNRWLEAALATGISPESPPADIIAQRNYKREVLDRLGPSLWVPATAPDFTAADLDGRKVTLKDFSSKNVILIFYLGGECLHCMEQLQQANKRLDAFRALDTEIVAVSKASLESLKSANLHVRLLSDPSFEGARRYQSYDDFEERELHSTILINKQGQVHWCKHGGDPFTDFDFLEAEIKRMAQREPMPPTGVKNPASTSAKIEEE
jgi:peroxiredoxin